MDFVLGGGSSYMESDVREDTDNAGFCRAHFQKMFDYGNTLGNAWILKTHYEKISRCVYFLSNYKVKFIFLYVNEVLSSMVNLLISDKYLTPNKNIKVLVKKGKIFFERQT